MKKVFYITVSLTFPKLASACLVCNKKVAEGISQSGIYPNLFIMLLAFIVLGIIVFVLSAISTKRHLARIASINGQSIYEKSPVPLTTASMVLGIGLGGFIDGIFLHQIFQTHEMLSSKIPSTNYIGKSINMFWDGIFHFFCLIVVLIGILLLWKLMKRKNTENSGRLLSGGLLLGWGLFNIVEGIINHHILKLHNVIEVSENPNTGNLIFLGVSVVILIAGMMLAYRRNAEQRIRR